jgi:RNA processing factor Prp31
LAIINFSQAKNWVQAINTYVNLLEEWISGNNPQQLNIIVPRNEKYSNLLRSRIKVIKKEILDKYQDEL